MDGTKESQANILCKACGLCCTGHLFIWAKLRPAELEPAESLGLTVFRSDPTQRGFSQPCPLWQGQCTIYESPQYPHVCRAYKCKLLKEVMGGDTSLSAALSVVEQAKRMIRELEARLPSSPTTNFRERLVAQLESLLRRETSASQENTRVEFQSKAQALLDYYERVFGVDDLVEKAE
jgi:putative zinc- or iron-chelating protein